MNKVVTREMNSRYQLALNEAKYRKRSTDVNSFEHVNRTLDRLLRRDSSAGAFQLNGEITYSTELVVHLRIGSPPQ